MKIAIPIANGVLCSHFGHCEHFAFLDVDSDSNEISNRVDLAPPGHKPGIIPKWVAEQGAKVVLAGGMGGMAVEIFRENGVEVHIGCAADKPETIVASFLEQTLVTGVNTCNHDKDDSCSH